MAESTAPLAIALYQPEAETVLPADRIERLRQQLSDARGQYDLVVCPELYLSGYCAGDRFHDDAEPLDGPFMRELGEVARAAQCAIAYGFAERTSDGLHNACAFLGPDGARLAIHRKTVFPQAYEQRYFVPGQGATIVDWRGWRIGMLICYEAEFPEAVRACAVRGCDLVIVPTALAREWSVVAQRVIPARAFENNLFIAYANYCGEAGETTFLGQSVIADPYGDDLARAGQNETIISAQAEKARIGQARERLHFLADLEQLGDTKWG